MIKFIPGDPFAHRGQHRKPSTAARTVAKVTALAVPMTLAGLMLVGATPLAAHASVTTAHSATWYDTHACRAFHTELRHPTAKHLARFDRYASHADTFIKVDGGLFYQAVRHHKPRIVVKTAAGWVEFDCATLNGYGL